MLKRNKNESLKSKVNQLLSLNMKLFLFFLTLLTSLQLKESSANDKYEILTHQYLTHSGTYVKQYHPHLPSESFPKPYQEEAADNQERFEHINDHIGLLNWNITTAIDSYSSSSVKRLFTQLLQSYQNQPQVALFILHHSWKSYLIA
ncbi:hypothetical protein [Pedobacter glucosidilyticus]|uniref:hypothetical protein n=1 Tax=Pedobacter glucosidilyticus TaxID=1122941 RepID=UPI000405BDB4|nr:hypothetical protein [Pedobacter glucosidilyticus]